MAHQITEAPLEAALFAEFSEQRNRALELFDQMWTKAIYTNGEIILPEHKVFMSRRMLDDSGERVALLLDDNHEDPDITAEGELTTIAKVTRYALFASGAPSSLSPGLVAEVTLDISEEDSLTKAIHNLYSLPSEGQEELDFQQLEKQRGPIEKNRARLRYARDQLLPVQPEHFEPAQLTTAMHLRQLLEEARPFLNQQKARAEVAREFDD